MSSQAALGKCAGCMKPIPKKEFLQCAYCKGTYDLDCINMSSQRFYSFYKLDKGRRDSWRCPTCVSNLPKKGNQNTPVRPSLALEPELELEQACNVTQRTKSTQKVNFDSSVHIEEDSCDNESPRKSNDYLKEFCEEMKAMRAEMSKFSSAMTDLTATLKAQNARIDLLEGRIEALESTSRVPQHSDIPKIEETIARLQLEIEERNQDLLANDVEIANFPETSNENSTHVILTISKKLGVTLDERDVVSAARVGAARVQSEAAAARPRPIVVRLARRASRDALLQAARVRRRLSAADMGLPGSELAPSPRPFYINERLTRHNRQLFQKARDAAKRAGWKYVWTRDGNIYARLENGKTRHRLTSEADLTKVFGPNAVGDL